MTKKRFTNIEHDYENAWIKCNDNGDFMIYAIYKELDESLPSLEDLLNGLANENKELKYKLRNCEDARYSYKQDWKACSSYCDEYKSEIISLKDEVEGLIEENKELKEKNKFILGQIRAFRDDCDTYLDFDGASTLNRLLDILGEER